MSTKVYIHSFGKALGARKVSNQDLLQYMDTSDEWIRQRSGIRSRYWVEPGQTTSSLAVEACREAMTRAGVKQVQGIVAATLSPDYTFPGIGVQIQNALGLPAVPAFDLRNQCSGFLYGLEMGAALVSSGQYQDLLLVGAEVHSTGLDLSTRGRDVAVLFGDGAGACLISREVGPQHTPSLQLLGTELHSDGAFMRELWCEHPGSANPTGRVTPQMVEEGSIFPKMNGRVVFEHAVRSMVEVCQSILKRFSVVPNEISLLVPHQANARINAAVAEHLGLRHSQVMSTIENYGNTTAATIPIGFYDAVEAQRLPPSGLILSVAFGSGFTWGAALFRVE